MSSSRQPTKGRMAAAAALIAALAVTLPAWQAAADHDGQRARATVQRGVTPLTAMPPQMARAYLLGIQEALFAHGYDPGFVDGVMGRYTLRAIRNYQRDAGLPADGLASKELLDHLKFALPKVYAGRAWREPTTPRQAPSAPTYLLPQPEAQDQYSYLLDQTAPQVLPEREIAPPPGGPGGPGGVVSQIQSELARLGYYNGPIDGLYGAETRRAVYRYQQDVGLPASGEIDQALLDALLPAEQGVGSLRL